MTLTHTAEALFTSTLQPSTTATPSQINDAIAHSLRTHGGVSGCTEAMATEYGEHPESAASRMRWALEIAATCNGHSR